MNREPLRRWIINNNDSFCRVKNVPARVANRLPDKYGYLDLKSSQNNSPTMKEMMDISLKYNGVLEGYIIPFSSRRKDCRISFDGFIINVSADIAMKLYDCFSPDEFSLYEGGYRFWWD